MIDWSKGDMYVPCDNPLVKSLMGYSSPDRRMNMGDFEPFKRHGLKYCAWCNQREVPSKRHKYCSVKCQISCSMFCQPTGYDGFGYLFYLQKGKCRLCGHDWLQYYINHPSFKKEIKAGNKINPFHLKHFVPKEHYMEMDHITPVALGGSILGHDNIQLICAKCHKIKTKQDMINIRGKC